MILLSMLATNYSDLNLMNILAVFSCLRWYCYRTRTMKCFRDYKTFYFWFRKHRAQRGKLFVAVCRKMIISRNILWNEVKENSKHSDDINKDNGECLLMTFVKTKDFNYWFTNEPACHIQCVILSKKKNWNESTFNWISKSLYF